MLGYVNVHGRGKIDETLSQLAEELSHSGMRVAGAVQKNLSRSIELRCHMDLVLLHNSQTVRISQTLGPDVSGCRLDIDAMTDVVGAVEAQLRILPKPDLVIINKFGGQEAEGRGFRAAIGAAIAEGVPTLVGVQDSYHKALTDWAGDIAERVEPDTLKDWCLRATGVL